MRLLTPLSGLSQLITIDSNYDHFLAKTATEDKYDHDTDEEDEFFDAIEANALPNMLVYEALTSPSAKSPAHDEASVAGSRSFANQQEQSLISMNADQGFYAGYAIMRTSLKLSAERPNASLWSVLKHSIGRRLIFRFSSMNRRVCCRGWCVSFYLLLFGVGVLIIIIL
jgi:hypothetical protein